MNGLETILAKPILQSLGWALLHFIWQGSLLALLYAASTIVLRRSSANLRYAVACLGLLLMLAAPVVTTIMIDRATAERSVSETEAAVSVKTLNNLYVINVSPGSNQAAVEGRSDSSSNMFLQMQGWWREQMPVFLPWL